MSGLVHARAWARLRLDPSGAAPDVPRAPGPALGTWVSADGDETSDKAGEVRISVGIDPSIELEVFTAESLRGLALDLLAAAEWLVAHS